MAQILTDINGILGSASIIQGALTVTNQGSSIDMANGNVSDNAIVEYGTPLAAVTSMGVQIEEWSGTTVAGQFSGNGATTWTAIPGMVGATVTTGPVRQLLTGLRTQRWVRANANIFSVATNANVPVFVEILEQPKSEGGSTFGTGYSNWPSSGSTNGT